MPHNATGGCAVEHLEYDEGPDWCVRALVVVELCSAQLRLPPPAVVLVRVSMVVPRTVPPSQRPRFGGHGLVTNATK